MSEDMNPAPEEPLGEDGGTPLEQFIFHQRRGLEEFGKAMESLLPPRFKEHTQAAGNEFATGFRVLIDAAIDEIKKASEMEDHDARGEAEHEAQARANLSADDEEDESSGAGSAGGKIKVELDD
ncbi:MAG: hypothetical protein OXI34_15350 [Chloroflexota bacterium]|nr:hypothetical protein [Chloroflexota bacterium]MDE2947284.1 hypothetical protein [Chloroflexota bacterium]